MDSRAEWLIVPREFALADIKVFIAVIAIL